MRPTGRTFDNQLLWVTIFGVAMAFFESSIVVYLRALYYPEGFSFPLSHIESHIGVTELIREFFSLVMIVSVAALTSRYILQRFAHFLYIFAVWDIFYYVFLKLVLGWPESLLTWDVLFLIPVTWSGPVITPLIISLIIVGFALVIRHFNLRSDFRFFMEPREWVILLAGALVVFVAFIWDYSRFVLGHLSWEMLREHDALKDKLEDIVYQYVPSSFNWPVFILGVILLLISLAMVYIRNRKRYD